MFPRPLTPHNFDQQLQVVLADVCDESALRRVGIPCDGAEHFSSASHRDEEDDADFAVTVEYVPFAGLDAALELVLGLPVRGHSLTVWGSSDTTEGCLMTSPEPRTWVVRGGSHGESDQRFLTDGIVGLGFTEFGDLSQVNTREAMKARALEVMPNAKPASAGNYSAQAWAFRGRIEVGDFVVVPLKGSPHVAIGRIVGSYQYLAEAAGVLHHIRKVEWLRTDVPRTVVGEDLLYSIGAYSTVVQIQRNDAAYRIAILASSPDAVDPGARPENAPKPPVAPTTPDDTELAEAAADSGFDIDAYVTDRITARIREKFDGHRLSQLVGAILEAEGFIVQVSPPGADGGVDILAGRGLFGMDAPRVVVQVKSEPKAVSDTVVSQLHGAVTRNQADQGLLVAMGGVTKPAEQQLIGQKFRIAVWDSERLQRAIFENYESLPADIKADLPLRRAWVLAE